MLSRLIEFSLSNRLFVLLGTGALCILGCLAALRLPIDAVPDLTNVQIQVLTDAGSLSPVEVERLVTSPLENALGGLPRVEELRSISRLGISVITLVFEEGTDLFWARQLISERLITASALVPSYVSKPEIGPLTTALGEILQFEVRGQGYSSTELRSILEWDIAPKLREVQGVTEVNSHGGYYRTYEVQPDPERMLSHRISIDDLAKAIESNNLTASGGYSISSSQQRFIQGHAMIESLEDIRSIVLRSNPSGTPLLMRDVAMVGQGSLQRQGLVTRDARGEAVIGMAMMLVGENSRLVVLRIKDRMKEIQETLPDGIQLEIIYDRSELIGRTLGTVLRNLAEGGGLVVIILFIMLGSPRAGFITSLAIPLSMLFAACLMYLLGVSASLMSLGAIDFGLIVDSSVIMIENCMHRLNQPENHAKPRLQVIRDACIEVRKPTMFGELIIAVVYLPILLLEGSEGKLFRPMALTVLFALAGSLVLSMTFMPAVASIALPRQHQDEERGLVGWLKRQYQPLLRMAIAHPFLMACLGLTSIVASIPVAYNLGSEFMPRLEEGDLLIEANRLPSASLEDAISMSQQIEQTILKFPEVKTVFCKTGRPEIANDVMGVQQTDVWVMLHPSQRWRPGVTRESLVEELNVQLPQDIAGASFAFTQPIEMRVDELVAGVKADVAVLIYGKDLTELARLGKDIERILKNIRGAADVKADYQANLSTLRIVVDRHALARYGLTAQQVMTLVDSLGQLEVGTVFEDRARYPIVIRMPEGYRSDLSKIKQLPVLTSSGSSVPLQELASISVEETPPAVEHELSRRRTFVQANVRGRDMGSFVVEAQNRVATELSLPAGYEIRWGGDYENLQSASKRLVIITPLVLLLISVLLHWSLRSLSLTCLILLVIPVAASGGIAALYLRGIPFSISAGVGFIALFGVAVLNGLVWVSSAEQRRESGQPISQVVSQTGLSRLRPILMTALVAGLGFIPMALSHSDGAEIQRPLATVVIGGLVTSTISTTLILPAIYPWFVLLSSVSQLESSRGGEREGQIAL